MALLEKRFQYELGDLWAAQRAFLNGPRGCLSRIAFLVFVWMGVECVLVSPYFLGRAYGVLVAGLTLLLALRPDLIMATVLRLNRRRIPLLQGESTLRFSDERVEILSSSASSICAWATFRSWRETRDVFLIYWRRSAAFVVPKRILSVDDQETLRALLRKKARPEPVDEASFPILPPIDPDGFEGRFHLVRRDLLEVARTARRGPFLRWFYRLAAFAGACWATFYVYYELTTHSLGVGLTIAAASMGLAFVFAAPLSDLAVMLRYRAQEHPETVVRGELDGLRFVSSRADVTLRYAQLLGYRETSTAFVLQAAPFVFHVVPKRALRAEQVSKLSTALTRSTRLIA